jgi:hypothetical protein
MRHCIPSSCYFVNCLTRIRVRSGDAGALFDSVKEGLFSLADLTLVYPGHDYRGNTVSTICEEKQWNPRFAGRDRHGFIQLMSQLNLPSPQRMAEAVPAKELCGNIRATVTAI